MENIITRFPPSPTGYLHVGGARTALFNWLYARRHHGKFILRIEDTDTQRSTAESTEAILEALEWLGIDWDEGPYFQSERYGIYSQYIQKLLDSGNAYYCTCTKEEVDAMRKSGMALNGKAKYDGTCREKGLAATEGAVVRFKVPEKGVTIVNDLVKGDIAFQNTDIEDFIIQRSDGTPMYNLAVVVDDITMKVNTIIRGDDHLSNTPKQLLLYRSLESEVPRFGHVPMVLGKDRSRLSKRHGAMSVTAYRDMGYLPDALLNYLVRLGWSHGNEEFFTRNELIEKFNLENIGKSAGVFDPEKLLALNANHIKAGKPSEISNLLRPFLSGMGIDAREDRYLQGAIETLNKRSKTLIEMAEGALFYFQDNLTYEEKPAKKFLKPDFLGPLETLVSKLEHIEDEATEPQLEDIFKEIMESTGLKFGKIAQPVRVALTGKSISPGIFEIMDVLGKEKCLARLKKAIQIIKTREE